MFRRSFSSILARSSAPSWPSPTSSRSIASGAVSVLAPSSFPSSSSSSSSSPWWSLGGGGGGGTTTPPSTAMIVAVRHRSTRSTRGLYDGRDVRFGNNVPFSMKKTRRRWDPNLQKKRVYSEVLDEMVPFHLTTSALRTIDKMGGLDEYLLRSKHVSTKGEGEGQRVRNRIIQKMTHREGLKKKAIDNGESVEDWDRIVLAGKKVRQQQQQQQQPGAMSVMEES